MTVVPPEKSINPVRSYWLTAPNTVDTAKLARDHVVRLLSHAGHHCALVENARLLTSEIVTNVFAHTDVPYVTVETTIAERRVLVATYDASRRSPTPRCPEGSEGHENGRGLLLVDSSPLTGESPPRRWESGSGSSWAAPPARGLRNSAGRGAGRVGPTRPGAGAVRVA
ncbi:hypothetical protein E1265_01560 [Streptomyces sp. 8K308]|uniref:ATP-binding protein n=1 Tax=Streptomyces sp. 8K308 TaxID=2530388 RepID=UPI0010495B87|nr:ATP-binding protein [Streptomyces sp. 8K308]TDC27603.1 hypothetical protein E1265_01560 [Streptomyces sp. 8K308]